MTRQSNSIIFLNALLATVFTIFMTSAGTADEPSENSSGTKPAVSPTGQMETAIISRLGESAERNRKRGVYGITFSPNGQFVATRSTDQIVRVWNAATGKQLCQLDGYVNGRVRDFIFDHESRQLLTISSEEDEPLIVWDIASGKPNKELKLSGQLLRRGSTPGKFVIHSIDAVTSFSTDGAKLVKTPHRPLKGDSPQLIDVACDQERLLYYSHDLNRVLLVRRSEYVSPFFSSLLGKLTGAFSPDGRYAAAGASLSPPVLLHDFERPDGKLGPTVHKKGTTALAFSSDGRHLAVGGTSGALCVLEVVTFQQVVMIEDVGDTIRCLAFSPDARRLSVGVSGARHNGALVLDFSEILFPTEGKELAAPSASVFTRLDHVDPKRAYQTMAQLVAHPDQTVPMINKHLEIPDQSFDPRVFDKLVAQLDHDKFAVRDHAFQELMKIRIEVRDSLKTAAENAVSLESRIRLRQLASPDHSASLSSIRQRQLMRIVLVLEQIGNEPAAKVLEFLQTSINADVARYATDSLARVQNRLGE